MNLVYLDESGNTGLNLKDRHQPIFVLAAIILHSNKWFSMEKQFHAVLEEHFGQESMHTVELHAADLKARRKHFKNVSLADCLNIRDRMLQILLDFEIPVIYQRIIKSKFEKFCETNYGPGIKINPYVMAFPFVCMEVNRYLQQKGPDELGMLIFDEQKESLNEVERSLRTLRLDQDSILKTTNLVEKGFFVDSAKSFPVQLVDLVAYYARKHEEHKQGLHVSDLDKQTFGKIRELTSAGFGPDTEDILEWVKSHIVK